MGVFNNGSGSITHATSPLPIFVLGFRGGGTALRHRGTRAASASCLQTRAGGGSICMVRPHTHLPRCRSFGVLPHANLFFSFSRLQHTVCRRRRILLNHLWFVCVSGGFVRRVIRVASFGFSGLRHHRSLAQATVQQPPASPSSAPDSISDTFHDSACSSLVAFSTRRWFSFSSLSM